MLRFVLRYQALGPAGLQHDELHNAIAAHLAAQRETEAKR